MAVGGTRRAPVAGRRLQWPALAGGSGQAERVEVASSGPGPPTLPSHLVQLATAATHDRC